MVINTMVIVLIVIGNGINTHYVSLEYNELPHLFEERIVGA